MNDLIHRIVGVIIEAGQSDTKKFRLGETIRYSPSEILEILKQHENEIFGEESSAQTNTSNTLNALDMIYRQAAIDALGEEPLMWCDTEVEITARAQWRQDRDAILSVPSAQPEYTDAEIQKMQDLEQAQIEKAYQLGYEEGRNEAQSRSEPNAQNPDLNEIKEQALTSSAELLKLVALIGRYAREDEP